tara:strand:- start:274 stop:513 length:240 start_codon:yes stop_codon:yes gene_type:complete
MRIPRFKTNGIYLSGPKPFRINRRTDHTVWLVKLDQETLAPCAREEQRKIGVMNGVPKPYEYTLTKRAFIRADRPYNEK